MPSEQERDLERRVAHTVATSSRFGTIAGNVHVIAAMNARKQAMVDREAAFHVKAYEESGAEPIMGRGVFVGPR